MWFTAPVAKRNNDRPYAANIKQITIEIHTNLSRHKYPLSDTNGELN